MDVPKNERKTCLMNKGWMLKSYQPDPKGIKKIIIDYLVKFGNESVQTLVWRGT